MMARMRPDGLAQPALVECHAYCRVDPHSFESVYFPLGLDAAGGNDRMRGGAAQLLEPLAVDSAHRALAIHIGAEKRGAKWLKLFHYLFGSNTQFFSPSLNHDMALGRIERYYNCRAA